MTMIFMKYNGGGAFLYAGLHLDIIIYRRATNKCETLETNGLYLGILPDISHLVNNLELKLEIGDIMLLYTDGIIEARNSEKGFLEPQGLIDIFKRHVDKPLDEIKTNILKETLEWCEYKQKDDIALILIKRKK